MKWKPEPSLCFVEKESSRTARCRAGETDQSIKQLERRSGLAAIVFVTRGELAQGRL
jgi:hypothetical protein